MSCPDIWCTVFVTGNCRCSVGICWNERRFGFI